MVVSCCAYGCTERAVRGTMLSFHNFPKNETTCKAWVNAIRRENFKPTASSRVCSKHFREEDYNRQKLGGNWLLPNAVPSIFNFPQHLQKENKTRKPPMKRAMPPSPLQPSESENIDEPGPSTETAAELAEDQPPKKKKKSFRYFGDFTEQDISSPTKVQKQLQLAKKKIAQQKEKLQLLRMQKRRCENRAANLKNIIQSLRDQYHISDSATELLEKSLPAPAADLLKRSQAGYTKSKFPPSLRLVSHRKKYHSAATNK